MRWQGTEILISVPTVLFTVFVVSQSWLGATHITVAVISTEVTGQSCIATSQNMTAKTTRQARAETTSKNNNTRRLQRR